MQDRDDSAGGVAGSVAGGAAVLGGAATIAYTADTMNDAGLFDDSSSSLQSAAGTSGTKVMPEEEASRFLAQATNGASRADIAYLSSIGISNWLVRQYSMGRSQRHWDFLVSRGSYALSYRGVSAEREWDRSIWKQLITKPDQLRQRVSLALLDIFVVGVEGLELRYPQWAMVNYMDLLMDHTFGNFRRMLGAITLSSAMGQFLTYIGSSKADSSGRMPDENYARELMQLFTLGLYELNMDGTARLDSAGNPIETYDQQDVTQLARVFTGLTLQGPDTRNTVHRHPLVFDPSKNETGPSTFLGRTVSGGGMTALNAALDVIFHHRNMAPFFSRALIQRLTTSNPSPAYIRRVANRFADNGNGVRGDMKAVITAVLTDTEARSTGAIGAPHTGKLRDPVQRITHWCRAFDAKSTSGQWYFGDMTGKLLNSPGRSQSVFNFFRPGFTPPNSELQRRGLVAPELQIADEQSVLAYINFMENLVDFGLGDMRAQYLALMPIADHTEALIYEINLVLAAGQLTAGTQAIIANTLNAIGSGTYRQRRQRIWTTILLVFTAPEYLVLQ